MSVSTLDFLSGLMTPDFLRNAAKATGETESGVSKALGAAFPAVLGQLANGAGDAGLMGNVISMIKNPAIGGLLGSGGGVLSSVGSLLAPTAASGPVGTVASTLLNMLFGKNMGGIIGALGSLAGLKNAGSASSLLSLAGPMVLAVLGNRLGGSVTGAALGALLGKEKSGIMSALPSALSGAMGLMGSAGAAAAQAAAPVVAAAHSAPAVARAPQAAAPATVHHEHEEQRGAGSSIIGSIIGLLITGAVLAGIVFALSQCNPKVASVAPPAPVASKAEAPAPKVAEAPKPAPPKPVEAPKPAAAAPAPAPAPAPVAAPAAAKAASLLAAMKPGAGGLMSLALPTGKSIELAEKGVESKLIGFLEDASRPIDKGLWFDFDRLNFKTGSSDLTAESRSQVESVAEIMKAFPTSQIKIGGYTDNQGDPAMNLKLSDDRAKRVMNELAGLGITAERVSAEGYGEQHAVADNGTAEGRAKNRRTALSVRQR